MGWARCGKDSNGRPIGYAYAATCDHPGCETEIDRGLSYACGGMHGNSCLGGDREFDWDANVTVCERYFCQAHLRDPILEHEDGAELYAPMMCDECASELERAYREDEDWREHWPTGAAPLALDRGMS